MDNSNKAIAKRINKELNVRGWKQTELLKRIIRFKNPNINKTDLFSEVNAKKGNFSTSLKGNCSRAIPKEDLYIISKILSLPLEYIWFGDDKKKEFVPMGARYVAFQDNEDEYRAYIAKLEYEDRIQYHDEFGFNLFDYFGQYDSINGYKYFVNHHGLFFDYVQSGQLRYYNSEGYMQCCSSRDDENLISTNLIRTLAEYKEVKVFRAIYFDNCSIQRFNPNFYHSKKNVFNEDFLKILLENESFLNLTMKTKEVDLKSLDRHYEKNEKRTFVEPMFFEALSFALKNEKEYSSQLDKMLHFALEYNKSQYEFIKAYLRANEEIEYRDVEIDRYNPHSLRSIRNSPMGNIIRLDGVSSNDDVNRLINKIEQYVFKATHIINEQKKGDDEIIITTPDNPLFIELHNNAIEQKAEYVPFKTFLNKEFTHFKYYESFGINVENVEQLQLVIDCLNKSQTLVEPRKNQVLVHGDLGGSAFFKDKNQNVGLCGWQKCHYGDKYEDRAELLSNLSTYYLEDKFLNIYKNVFDVLSQGFSKEEQIILVDRAMEIISKRIDSVLNNPLNTNRAIRLQEQLSRLDFFKKYYLNK